MEPEKILGYLRGFYVGALAESCGNYQRFGILEKLEQEKQTQLKETSAALVHRLGLAQASEAFTALQEIFACARWRITAGDFGFVATCQICQLCSAAKRLGAGNPCRLFCLLPIEGMVSVLAPGAAFVVGQTLWAGDCCRVQVGSPGNVSRDGDCRWPSTILGAEGKKMPAGIGLSQHSK